MATGRHRTSSEASWIGPGDGGTRGPARPGQGWAARDCRPRTQGQGAEEGRQPSIYWMPWGSFAGSRCREIQEITFKIGMLGQHEQDINDPQEKHVLWALPGMDIGAELGEEWEMVERLMDLQ